MVGHITLLQKFIFCPNFNFSQMPQPQQKKTAVCYHFLSAVCLQFLAVCLRFVSCLLTKLDFSNVPLKLNFCNSVDLVCISFYMQACKRRELRVFLFDFFL